MHPALFLVVILAVTPPASSVPPNPAIDMKGFLRDAREAARARELRRLSEDDFIRMSREPGTVVLDARSGDRFDLLHVKGAVHLAFTDFTARSLARVIPTHDTRILIYCNNNFTGDETAFATKMRTASLNLSTFVALHSYGYDNVYELGPRLDVKDTRLELVPTAPGARK